MALIIILNFNKIIIFLKAITKLKDYFNYNFKKNNNKKNITLSNLTQNKKKKKKNIFNKIFLYMSSTAKSFTSSFK